MSISRVHGPLEGGFEVRKKVTAVILALFVFSLIAASAASLGGITTTADLGAETTAIVGCDTDGITIAFTTTYNSTNEEFDIATVEIGDLDGCDGQTIDVEVFDSAGASLGSATGTVSGALDVTHSASISASALAVDGVAVVVSG